MCSNQRLKLPLAQSYDNLGDLHCYGASQVANRDFFFLKKKAKSSEMFGLT